MIDKQIIENIATKYLDNEELFIVDIVVSGGGDIEITIDSDQRVSIDECVRISRSVDRELEEMGEEDYSIVVSSAGIGVPFKHPRQFAKAVGKSVEVVKRTGEKLVAVLQEYTSESLTLSYEQKVLVEGKKRKELQEVVEKCDLQDIKSVCEALTIK